MKIDAIIKRPNEMFGHKEKIENTLEAMQRIVEGYIEVVNLGDGVLVVCNEEGLIRDMPLNCRIGQIVLFGPVIVLGEDGEEFADVPISLRKWASMIDKNL